MQAQVAMPKSDNRKKMSSNLLGVSLAPKSPSKKVEDDSFVTLLQVDIKSGRILVDNREKLYWTV